jgi:hypothetical protein
MTLRVRSIRSSEAEAGLIANGESCHSRSPSIWCCAGSLRHEEAGFHTPPVIRRSRLCRLGDGFAKLAIGVPSESSFSGVQEVLIPLFPRR